MRQRVLHAEKDTAQINSHHRFPLIDGLVLKGPVMATDPGIVDKDVEVTKARDCKVNYGFDLLFRANIDIKPTPSSSASMDVSNQAFASLLPAMIADHNVRTFLSKQPADLAPNSRVSTDDECLLVLQTIHAALGCTEP